MSFVFLDEEEEDDEDFLDLSDLETEEEEEQVTDEELDTGRVGRVREGTTKVQQDSAFAFEDDIPAPKSITDEEVKVKARRGRKRSVATMDYYGKRDAGWSLFCAHKKHLPNLCERGMNNGEHTCTCSCHEQRGYVFAQSNPVPNSDDEEILLLLD